MVRQPRTEASAPIHLLWLSPCWNVDLSSAVTFQELVAGVLGRLAMNRKPSPAASGRRLGAYVPIAALLLCGLVSPATMHADTYTYTGMDLGPDADCGCSGFAPYTTSDNITGYFTVSGALSPGLAATTDIASLVTDFSFTDGLQTFNYGEAGLTTVDFQVGTDSMGAIDAWEVLLVGPTGSVFSCSGDPNPPCLPGPGWGAGEGDEASYEGSVGLVRTTPAYGLRSHPAPSFSVQSYWVLGLPCAENGSWP